MLSREAATGCEYVSTNTGQLSCGQCDLCTMVDGAEQARKCRGPNRTSVTAPQLTCRLAVPEGPEGQVTVTAYAWMAPAEDCVTMETGRLYEPHPLPSMLTFSDPWQM